MEDFRDDGQSPRHALLRETAQWSPLSGVTRHSNKFSTPYLGIGEKAVTHEIIQQGGFPQWGHARSYIQILILVGNYPNPYLGSKHAGSRNKLSSIPNMTDVDLYIRSPPSSVMLTFASPNWTHFEGSLPNLSRRAK